TTTTTRTSGTGTPPATRNSVCSGERVLRVNDNWKTLGPSADVVTCTCVSASRMSCETGSGTAGPIISVRGTPVSIRRPPDALGQGDEHPATDGLDQLVGAERGVRVAQPPEQLGVAQVPGGQVVEPVPLCNRVLLDHGEPLRRRDEAAPEEHDQPAVGRGDRVRLGP